MSKCMGQAGKSEMLEHHKQAEYCLTRPKYRKGKKLTAVKVYSVVNESRHILVFGVPKVNLRSEMKKLFSRYGTLESISVVTDEIHDKGIEVEQFTDCFHIVFKKDFEARKAKKFLDARQFYGGILHISYAPEREAIADTLQKLENRRREVTYRLQRVVEKRNPKEDESSTKMLIKDEVRCSVCTQIFCCASCRIVHEEKQHVDLERDNELRCFLCQRSNIFPMKTNVTQELLEHLVEKHLPLNCIKCKKVYNSKGDFNEIKNCMEKNMEISKIEVDDSSAKKDLPEIEVLLANGKINEEMLTPLTKINLKWRRKSAGLQVSVSDHSGFENSKSNSSTAKICRTTSTPMFSMTGQLMKPITLDSLCSSSFQPSSIEHSSDSSVALTPESISPSPEAPKQKHGGQRNQRSIRQCLPISQTPLRQVMSKSIQKAIQEHGRLVTAQRKIAFTSMSSSDTETAPLDLRTTPALKRSASDPMHRSITFETKAVQSQALPKVSVTCVANNESTTIEHNLQESQTSSNEPISAFLSCQPDISFITPQKLQSPNNIEIWYTPLPFVEDTTPMKTDNDENMEELAAPQKEAPEPRFTGMIRRILKISEPGTGPPASSLLYRAASFAGFIRKKKTPVKAQKRRRIQVSPTSPPLTPPQSPIAKKYKSIHGRRPIRRLRTEQ